MEQKEIPVYDVRFFTLDVGRRLLDDGRVKTLLHVKWHLIFEKLFNVYFLQPDVAIYNLYTRRYIYSNYL